MSKITGPSTRVAKPVVTNHHAAPDTQSRELQAPLAGLLQRAQIDPQRLLPADVMSLQRMIGNQGVARLLAPMRQSPIRPSSGEPLQRQYGAEGGELSSADAKSLQSARGGGAPLNENVRRSMESRFGADFSGVRVHAGRRADQLNRTMDAHAFTTGNDIFFAQGQYQPEGTDGQRLLAHELTHVVQQTGAGNSVQRDPKQEASQHDTSHHEASQDGTRNGDPGAASGGVTVRQRMAPNRISPKRRLMYLDFVRMKRQDQDMGKIIKKKLGLNNNNEDDGDGNHHDTYGHWWTEIGAKRDNDFNANESYGWWPKDGAPGGLKKLFGGVEGALNQEGPTARRDPHHGDPAAVEFHPVMKVDPEQESYSQIRTRVTNDIRQFAQSYKGKWHWKLGWGKNCHTFQQAMKTKVGLHYQKAKEWLVDPQIEADRQAAEAAAQEREQAKQNVVKTFTIPKGYGLDVNDAQGSDLGGTIREGEQVGATGVVKEVTHRNGYTYHYGEYVRMTDGSIYYSEGMNWNNVFGEQYPLKTDDSSTDTPENMSQTSSNNTLILDLSEFGL